jgi:CRISPR-associated protein Csb2
MQGAVSAYPSSGAPEWMRWRLPASLANRPLIHAEIYFSEPVEGPLLLGAGRFLGMGLCRSLTGDQ